MSDIQTASKKTLKEWIVLFFVPVYLLLSSLSILVSRNSYIELQKLFPVKDNFVFLVMTSEFVVLAVKVILLSFVVIHFLAKRKWAEQIFNGFLLYFILLFLYNLFARNYGGFFGLGIPAEAFLFDLVLTLFSIFVLSINTYGTVVEKRKKHLSEVMKYIGTLSIIAIFIYGVTNLIGLITSQAISIFFG